MFTRKSRLKTRQQARLIEHFAAGSTAFAAFMSGLLSDSARSGPREMSLRFAV